MQKILFALVASYSILCTGTSAQAQNIVGCYRADRALGNSANSAFGIGVPGTTGHEIGEDSASLPRLQTFRLRKGGRVERPDASGSATWQRWSSWTLDGDTLHVTLSTMMSGWRLTLTKRGADEYVGTARYLTDVVINDGRGPLEVPLRVAREPCTPQPRD